MGTLRASVLALTLVLLPLHAADAGLIRQEFAGTIDRADPGNFLGVMAGDTFRITIDFDPDEALVSGNLPPFLVFQFNARSMVQIELPGLTLREFNDFDFGDGGPSAFLTRDGRAIDSFSFRSFFNGDGVLDPESDQLDITAGVGGPGVLQLLENEPSENRRITVQGTTRFVPEPAHMLGLGLALLAWRRHTGRPPRT